MSDEKLTNYDPDSVVFYPQDSEEEKLIYLGILAIIGRTEDTTDDDNPIQASHIAFHNEKDRCKLMFLKKFVDDFGITPVMSRRKEYKFSYAVVALICHRYLYVTWTFDGNADTQKVEVDMTDQRHASLLFSKYTDFINERNEDTNCYVVPQLGETIYYLDLATNEKRIIRGEVTMKGKLSFMTVAGLRKDGSNKDISYASYGRLWFTTIEQAKKALCEHLLRVGRNEKNEIIKPAFDNSAIDIKEVKKGLWVASINEKTEKN